MYIMRAGIVEDSAGRSVLLDIRSYLAYSKRAWWHKAGMHIYNLKVK